MKEKKEVKADDFRNAVGNSFEKFKLMTWGGGEHFICDQHESHIREAFYAGSFSMLCDVSQILKNIETVEECTKAFGIMSKDLMEYFEKHIEELKRESEKQ